MRNIVVGLLIALLPLTAYADTDQWGRTVTCGAGVTPDGTAVTTCSVDGLSISADTQAAAMSALNSMVPPQPPVVVTPKTIPPFEFMNRLTQAEQTAIAQASQSNASIMLFMLKLASATEIDVTEPTLQSGMSAMVSAGLLTQARATQIANLAVPSP